MPKRVEVTLIILWKNERWEERTITMHMPGGSTEQDAVDAAIKATISNLAAIGKLDEVKTMGHINRFIEIDVKEKKEEDAASY